MSEDRKLWTGFFAYILFAIVTFGHAASHTTDPCPQDRVCLTSYGEKASMNGLLAGMFWPLYWSWEIWETGGVK